MTIGLALEYIPRRMKELGYGSDYYLSFRHLVLRGKEKQEFDAHNQLYILVEGSNHVNIESDFGVYDLEKIDTNEQIYEHQGFLRIENRADANTNLKFIQVIPKSRK